MNVFNSFQRWKSFMIQDAKAGVKVVIMTGRSYSSTSPLLKSLTSMEIMLSPSMVILSKKLLLVMN